MNNFMMIDSGIDVRPAREQLLAHPELWNDFDMRTGPESPHCQVDDIFVRYNARDKLANMSREEWNGPHFPEYYPAWQTLSHLGPIVFRLMSLVHCVHLGAILITRIPGGKKVLPHVDGGWHAEYHNCKVYVPLLANDWCVNSCGDETIVMKEGEAWTFNNLIPHDVQNHGLQDRITLIVCMRVES